MNYPLLIEERVSNKVFQNSEIAEKDIAAIKEYYDTKCARLIPEIKTDLIITGADAKEALEKAAGYNEFLIGAPHYLVITSEDKEGAILNAGYIMEDLILKLYKVKSLADLTEVKHTNIIQNWDKIKGMADGK